VSSHVRRGALVRYGYCAIQVRHVTDVDYSTESLAAIIKSTARQLQRGFCTNHDQTVTFM